MRIKIVPSQPFCFYYSESLSTLRYASRAKMIKNTPKVNMGALDSALADMQVTLFSITFWVINLI
jgi:hypothetical protein